jgi:sarcosine oxidase, subunit beta
LEEGLVQGGRRVKSNGLPKTADIVILGAGVMGASIAFHLAKRKAGRIVVIEKDHVASGGSGRSSALVRMHYSYPPEVQLALVSLKMFENWREIVGEPGEFKRTGFVRIVHPNEMDRLKKNVAMQRELGSQPTSQSRDMETATWLRTTS